MGTLEVVIPPDILNDDTSEADGVALEGGSVKLRCQATGIPEPSIKWKREDSKNIALRHDGARQCKYSTPKTHSPFTSSTTPDRITISL